MDFLFVVISKSVEYVLCCVKKRIGKSEEKNTRSALTKIKIAEEEGDESHDEKNFCLAW